MFLPWFDVFCDLLLNRRTATWNLFVLYNNEEKAIFISKSLNISYITESRPLRGFCPLGEQEIYKSFAKSTNLKENTGQVKSVFVIRAAL